MSNLVSFNNIGIAEATTLTAQINTAVQKALEEQGKDQVSELVLQKNKSPLDATQPLHRLSSASTNEHRARERQKAQSNTTETPTPSPTEGPDA